MAYEYGFKSPIFEREVDNGAYLRHHSSAFRASLGYVPVYVARRYFQEEMHATIGWWTIPNFYGPGISLTPVATAHSYRDFAADVNYALRNRPQIRKTH